MREADLMQEYTKLPHSPSCDVLSFTWFTPHYYFGWNHVDVAKSLLHAAFAHARYWNAEMIEFESAPARPDICISASYDPLLGVGDMLGCQAMKEIPVGQQKPR